MRTYFINEHGSYFIINEPVNRQLMKGGCFETKCAFWEAISQRQNIDIDMIEDSEIIIFREGTDLNWSIGHDVNQLTINLYDFINSEIV